MKNSIYTVLLVALAAVLFVSCESTNKNNGKLDPSAKIYISPAQGVKLQTPTKADPEHLTAKQIIETAQRVYTNNWHLDVGDWNRDLANSRFIVGSDWAINQQGELTYEFIGARNYTFVTLDQNLGPKDTIAYIPNSIMQSVETAIKAAYDAENYSECYRLLQEAFVFTPINGSEYKVLQAKGEN